MRFDITKTFHVKVYSHAAIACEVFFNNISVTVKQKKDFVYETVPIRARAKKNNVKIIVTSPTSGAIYYKLKVGKIAIYRSDVFDVPNEGQFVTEIDFSTDIRQFGDKKTTELVGKEFDEDVAYHPLGKLELKQHYDDICKT